MSEDVDRIISDHLTQRPGARHAYDHDPTMHHDIERARSMLTVVEAAMQREGIPYDSAERVLNEVVSAGLDGWEREKRQEALAMLAVSELPPEFVEQARSWGADWETIDAATARPVRPDEEPNR